MNKSLSSIPDEVIINKIFFIRNQKVMLDRDLAELYEVETKALKQAVKRNSDIFPENFMFELTKVEYDNLRSQIVTSSLSVGNSGWGGTRYLPFAFTEHGVLQLANVLKSKRARKMSIRIIEVFVKMREILLSQIELMHKIEKLEKKDIEQDEKIILIFEYLKQFEQAKQQQLEQANRKRIGFKTDNE